MNIIQIAEIVIDSVLSIGTHKVINEAAKKVLPVAMSKSDRIFTKIGMGAVNLLIDYNVCKAVHEMIEPEPTKRELIDIINVTNETIDSTNNVLEQVAKLEVQNSTMIEHLVKLSMTKDEYAEYMRDIVGGGVMNGRT